MDCSPPSSSSAQSPTAATLRRVRAPSSLLLQPRVLCTEIAASASSPRTSSRRRSSSSLSMPSRPSAISRLSATSSPERFLATSSSGMAALSRTSASSPRTSSRRRSASSLSTPSRPSASRELFLATSSTDIAALSSLELFFATSSTAALSSPTSEGPSHVTPLATMDELGEPLSTDELGDPVDIPVDVIHRFARRQAHEALGEGGGLDLGGMGRAAAVAGRGDGLGENDDVVHAYTATCFYDDDDYDITDCFPKEAFFYAALVLLLVAFWIFHLIVIAWLGMILVWGVFSL